MQNSASNFRLPYTFGVEMLQLCLCACRSLWKIVCLVCAMFSRNSSFLLGPWQIWMSSALRKSSTQLFIRLDILKDSASDVFIQPYYKGCKPEKGNRSPGIYV